MNEMTEEKLISDEEIRLTLSVGPASDIYEDVRRLVLRIKSAEDALRFYADKERWIERQVIAEGGEIGHRIDEFGESHAIVIERGKSLGISFHPTGRLRADHGLKARSHFEKIKMSPE
jgi:hypothetical protein